MYCFRSGGPERVLFFDAPPRLTRPFVSAMSQPQGHRWWPEQNHVRWAISAAASGRTPNCRLCILGSNRQDPMVRTWGKNDSKITTGKPALGYWLETLIPGVNQRINLEEFALEIEPRFINWLAIISVSSHVVARSVFIEFGSFRTRDKPLRRGKQVNNIKYLSD